MAPINGCELYKWQQKLGMNSTSGTKNGVNSTSGTKNWGWTLQMAPRTGGGLYKWHQELGVNSTSGTKNWGWTLQMAPKTEGELYKWHQELGMKSTSGTKNRFTYLLLFICLMWFNATLNNISSISWQSVLLLEETGGPAENHRPVGSH